MLAVGRNSQSILLAKRVWRKAFCVCFESSKTKQQKHKVSEIKERIKERGVSEIKERD